LAFAANDSNGAVTLIPGLLLLIGGVLFSSFRNASFTEHTQPINDQINERLNQIAEHEGTIKKLEKEFN